MQNPKLVADMQTIVDRHVKYWKEDFDKDKESITIKDNSLPMVWIVRECGTVLISCPEIRDEKEIEEYYETAKKFIDYYSEEIKTVANRFYIIQNDKIKKTTAKECIEQINKNKDKAQDYQEWVKQSQNAA